MKCVSKLTDVRHTSEGKAILWSI